MKKKVNNPINNIQKRLPVTDTRSTFLVFNLLLILILIGSMSLSDSFLNTNNNSFKLLLFELLTISTFLININIQSTKNGSKKRINKKVTDKEHTDALIKKKVLGLILLIIPASVLAFLITSNVYSALVFIIFFFTSSSIKLISYQNVSLQGITNIVHWMIIAFGLSLMIAILVSGVLTKMIGESLTFSIWSISYFLLISMTMFSNNKNTRRIFSGMFIFLLIINLILLSNGIFINHGDTLPKYKFDVLDMLKECNDKPSIEAKDLCIYSVSSLSRVTDSTICEKITSEEYRQGCKNNIIDHL